MFWKKVPTLQADGLSGRYPTVRCLTFLLLMGWLTAVEAAPHVLLIVADDLGFSDLGCYGGEIDTPHLDALAADGLRLTQHYTSGRCCPSRASLLTGRYAHAVGLGHMTQDLGRPGYAGRVSPGARTLAQRLGAGGYRCFLAGKWHLGTEDPTQHGFEEFYGTLTSAKTFWQPDHMLRLPAGKKVRHYEEGNFYATDAVTDHALDFLEQARQTPERPWFLYLAYHAPHFPLQARKEDIAKYAGRYTEGWDVLREERLARMKNLGVVSAETELTPRSPWWNYGATEQGVNPPWTDLPEARRTDLARRMAIHAAMVDRMDHNIGRMVENVKAAGEWDDTVVIFVSDNGACAEWDPRGFDGQSSNHNVLHEGAALEAMGGPGTFHSLGSGWANASNTPWRLYKHFNHEGGISSPCIVHWPAGSIRPWQDPSREQPSHLIDWMPTLLAAAGVECEPGGRMDGLDLLPMLRGSADLPERTLFFEHEGHRAARRGPWKAVALREAPWELYRIDRDRSELHDVASGNPERLEALTQAWTQWAESIDALPFPRDYQVDYLPRH